MPPPVLYQRGYNIMKALLMAVAMVAMLSGTAFAQHTSSNSSATASNRSTSGASAVSNPTASAVASPTVNTRQSLNSRNSNTTNVTVNNGSGDPSGDPSSGTSGGDPTINYTGGYTVHTTPNTPDVVPPAISGGNICAVGASAGIGLAGVGIAGGATWADKPCERRQEAALLYNMGNRAAAFYLLSEDEPKIAAAMHAAGYNVFGLPLVAPAPAVAAPPPHPKSPPPGWCASETPQHLATLSDGQR